MNLAVAVHPDVLELWWTVAAPRHLGQALTGFLEPSQNMVGSVTTVGPQDIR
jgi:hypothetical protein